MEAKAKEKEADVYIYEEIGFWGVNAKQFCKDLNALSVEKINLYLNSPGGSVFDGVAIYNALVRHRAEVHVTIDGLAASIASVIAMAGDRVVMMKGSMLMVHKPWTVTFGDADVHRKNADLLDKIQESILDIYQEKTRTPRDQLASMMNEETWFTEKEALQAGFVDEIGAESSEGTSNRFDLSVFAKAPKRQPETIREFENFIREECGFSANQAKAIASGGFKAASKLPGVQPEPLDGAGAGLLMKLKSLRNGISG